MLPRQQQKDEQMGLFTFYRQQADHDDWLKNEKRRKKELKHHKLIELQASSIMKQEKKQMIKIEASRRQNELKKLSQKRQLQNLSKNKVQLVKERLMESIVNMGSKQIESISSGMFIEKFNYKEPAFVALNKKNRMFLNHSQPEMSFLHPIKYQTNVIDEMHIQSLHKRHLSVQEIENGKPVIHSLRHSSFQLPEIKKSEDKKGNYKPKKCIKSQLLEEALHTKDKLKIKEIRNYLKGNINKSNLIYPQQQQKNPIDIQIDEKSFQIFELKQQKLLGILKRFRKY